MMFLSTILMMDFRTVPIVWYFQFFIVIIVFRISQLVDYNVYIHVTVIIVSSRKSVLSVIILFFL